MRILGIIPARYHSTRFPGKPLAMIEGKSMIKRVYEQASKCTSLDDVVVATDNTAIFQHVQKFGGKAVITASHHHTGTERCHEAMEFYEKEQGPVDVVLNIQGDEPFISPEQIKKVIDLFTDPTVVIGTLVKRIDEIKQLKNPNIVKVVANAVGRAVYFSRAAIPFVRDAKEEEWLEKFRFFKHIGLYGYRSETLRELVVLEKGILESAESLEQLRWIENGYHIQTGETQEEATGIDTYEDLFEAVKNLKREQE